jgi:putative hydrolase of the HAD superfamily
MTASNGLEPEAPEAVLFDLDDTLYPERQFVDGGFRAVGSLLAAELGLDGAAIHDRLWELHAARGRHAAHGRGRLFDALLAEHGVADEDLVRACLVVYRTHAPALSALPGVERLLERLATGGAGLGLVSDGIASVQWRKLAALPGIADWLDVVIMTDELGDGHAKPAPTAFRVGCRLLEVEPAAAVYVANDPRKDFRGAREAGLRTVRFGAMPDEGAGMDRSFADADDADIAADSIEALARILGVDGPARPDHEVTIP